MSAQATKKPRYVSRFIDRHGKERWYFRRAGHPRIALPALGSPGFDAAYKAALGGEAPVTVRAEKRPPRTTRGYVYFLRCRERIKIGFSKDPFSRVAALRTGLSDPISAFVTVPGTVADEQRLHRIFLKERSAGEWFLPSPELVRAMAQAAAYGKLPEKEDASL